MFTENKFTNLGFLQITIVIMSIFLPSKELCVHQIAAQTKSPMALMANHLHALVENEVSANSEVSVKSGVSGPLIQIASRRIIWKSNVANASAILPPSWKSSLPESADIRNPFQYFQQFLTKNYLIIFSNKVTCMLCKQILPNHYFSQDLNWNNSLGQNFI